MIKRFGVILVLGYLFLTHIHTAQTSGYYNSTAGKYSELLKSELHLLTRGHIRYPYSSGSTDVWDILKDTDADTNNASNVTLFYTGWTKSGEGEYQGGSGWNREHVWPKSHGFPDESDTAYTDVHHLRPSDVTVNSARGNKDFDNGGSQYIDGDGTTYCYSDSDSWEPRDEVKGDAARIILYMVTRYEGGDGYDLELVDYTGTNGDRLGKLSTLLEWNRLDPPDDFERNRNNVIESYQNNRNPFIDHPEFADRLYNSSGIVIESAVETNGGVVITFNKTINSTSASNTANYVADRGIGAAAEVIPNYDNNSRKVWVRFNGLASQTKYNMSVSDVRSLTGQTIIPNSVVTFSTTETTQLSLAQSSLTVNENVGSVSLTVNISNPSQTVATSIDLVLTSGSVSDINNYTTQTLTFPAGSASSRSFTINVTDDNIEELKESFTFQLQNAAGSNVVINSPDTFTLTIRDNDTPVYDLIITEIHYQPSNAQGLSESYEFVEIFNNDNSTIHLEEYYFSSGIDFTFPASSVIEPNEFIVITSDTNNYLGFYKVFEFTGILTNGGETISLANSSDVLLDEVTYSESSPWPTNAGGTGKTIELSDFNSDNNEGRNWNASTADNGTPGAHNSNGLPATDLEILLEITDGDVVAELQLGIDTNATAGLDRLLGENKYPRNISSTNMFSAFDLGSGIYSTKSLQQATLTENSVKNFRLLLQPGNNTDEYLAELNIPQINNEIAVNIKDEATNGNNYNEWYYNGVSSFTISNQNIGTLLIDVHFTFEDMEFTSVSSSSVSQFGGDTLTISGANFGLRNGSVTINNTTCTILNWSNSSIDIVVPASNVSGSVNLQINAFNGDTILRENEIEYINTIDDNLLAHFGFSGNIVNPVQGNISISNQGVQFGRDRNNNPNSALYFDGVDDYMDISVPDTMYNNSFSISFYLVDNSGDHILSYFKGNAGNYTDDIVLGLGNTTLWLDGAEDITVNRTQLFGTTNKYITLIWNSDSQLFNIFVDGVLSGTSGEFAPQNTNRIMRFGANHSRNSFWQGSIDELRIHSRQLNIAEMKYLNSLSEDASINIIESSVNQSYTIGDTVKLKWSSIDVPQVNISFSTDNGANWTAIAQNLISNEQPFRWVVPEYESYDCKFRINSGSNETIGDTLSGTFTVFGNDDAYYRGYPAAGEAYPVVVQNISFNGEPLEVGDEIGVFDDENGGVGLVGASIYNGDLPMLVHTYLQFDSGDILVPGAKTGNEIKFRIYKKRTKTEYVCSVVFRNGGKFGDSPLSIAESVTSGSYLSKSITVEQNKLRYFSLPFELYHNSIDSVFTSVKPDYIFSDDEIYLPQPGFEDFEFNPYLGYLIYKADQQFNIDLEGIEFGDNPTVEIKDDNYTHIGFPYTTSHTALELFGNTPEIKYAENGSGEYYLPEYGLTDFVINPGDAIKVYSDSGFTYTYPSFSSANKRKGSSPEETHVSEFSYTKSGRIYPIVIETINDEFGVLSDGDEFGIFDGNVCVGSGIYYSDYEAHGFSAWMEVKQFEVPGAEVGSNIFFKLKNNDYRVQASFYKGGKYGDGVYSVANLSITENIPDDYKLVQNYPNPFNPSTTIEFHVKEEGRVMLSLYNIIGERINVMLNENMEAGYHSVKLRLDGFSSGIYLYQLTVNGFSETKKMILMK